MGPGGAEGTRTPYLNTASVALSRMSYSPRTTRYGSDPLIGPVTEATRRRLVGRTNPRFTVAAHGRVRPRLPSCTARRLAGMRGSTTPGHSGPKIAGICGECQTRIAEIRR